MTHAERDTVFLSPALCVLSHPLVLPNDITILIRAYGLHT